MRLPAGFAEVPCARCGTFTPGLQFGELCPDCFKRRSTRANRLSRLISLAATALFAAYVSFRIPPTPKARMWAVISVVLVFLIVRRVVKRVAMDALRD
jgi:hypothetical protein